MPRAVIVGGARTPFVRAFAEFTTMDTIALGEAAVRGLLEKTGVPWDAIDGVVWGGVILPPPAPNVAREIVLDIGLPKAAEARTVTRACASGLQAITDAVAAIERGDAEVMIAGGSDSTSNAPVTMPQSLVHKVAPVALSRKSGPMDYVKAIGKTPITVNDSRGFFTSRVFATYVGEGLAMVGEGVSPALIENAGRIAGMPVGPLALADEVSLDLMHKIATQTKKDMGDAYRAGPQEPVMAKMVEGLGRIGKKAAKGFYDYPEGGEKRLWPGLGEAFPAAADQPAVEEVIRRLMFIQSVETVRCMDEGVVTDPNEADVGSVMGWGFSPSRGGVVSQIDMVGVDAFVAECDRLAQAYGERFMPPQSLRDRAAAKRGYYDKAA